MKEDMKALIAETFTQLLEKEDIDKITVTKLIGECHISRQTFYYHFQDIMDVLEWTFRRSTEELTQKSLEEENDIDALRVFASFIRKNRLKLEKLTYSRRWIQTEGMLVESATTFLAEMVRSRVPDIEISYDDLENMLRFYAAGMVGVLLQYAGKPNLNEEKMIIQIERIITGKMFPGRAK